jgi:hypothetical protein
MVKSVSAKFWKAVTLNEDFYNNIPDTRLIVGSVAASFCSQPSPMAWAPSSSQGSIEQVLQP